ncbi:flagellar hook-associated protein FlgK [Heyndrickxia oleronia]|uniref:Flagellar hook-associated protein 1 n=1 Tax=Heyndrickxia oleronia TaxID=38875 RepID=A0A8E2I6C5_9BACI|nr:flagellar hook-associated protein FlgK [Heyndrickxia oleronia]MEC1377391.1 flagellar hook-associated protein FlgK [Heyndrickxia oleronia]OOP67541.1 flagellar hook-associated protein FlgK [Heyndrickxia oleronia]QQZ06030.1 flagellar hook-associated protein FlgK [Heyndrickxia oleronia]
MFSTFHGLETAKRGMNTQQSALYVTGQNISNANTLGYTRQRVNFEASPAYPAASMNRPQIPGQMGTGVQAGSIQRVRESFIDQQYRGENNKFGYWSTKAESLAKLEDIMNEPSDSGLAATLGQFWQSLQDLSVNPENDGARSVVLQRGQAVAETFHYLSSSMKEVKKDLGNEINVSIRNINSILEQIGNVNKQISEIEPHGYIPNDLYDERDRLVDELSSYVNIKIETTKSGGNPSSIAEGIYNIKMIDENGQETSLIDGSKFGKITEIDEETSLGQLNIIGSDNSSNNLSFDKIAKGKLSGLIESFGYLENGNGTEKGIYPEMLKQLNDLASTFITKFNEQHVKGWTLDGNQGEEFFGGSNAEDIKVLITSNENIAAAGSKDSVAGDGKNAIDLANVQSTANITSKYQSIIGKLGVDAQQANRLTANSGNLLQSVDERRQSVSAVSIDEEFINMIKYQQAYNASARNITIVDEMLDKIINGMGLGGR